MQKSKICMTQLLEVSDLKISYQQGPAIVEDLSFSLAGGEILALVGESGCGKSLSGLAILRLLPRGIMIEKGNILFREKELTSLPEEGIRRIRGRELAIVFQDPMASLNPVFTVGDQVAEVLEWHFGYPKEKALQRAAELFKEVGIPAPRERLRAYPHELSGGMRQRVMIAMALAGEPALLIADEPTTALDVTIQAQILELLAGLRKSRGLSILLITHDLGVVAELADRVAVMYAGRLVEVAPCETLYEEPAHPYTRALLAALPRPGQRKLYSLPGSVPPPGKRPAGCKFVDRCPQARPLCRKEEPPLELWAPDHWVRCFYAGDT